MLASKVGLSLFLLVACGLCGSVVAQTTAPTTAPASAGPLAISATASAGAVHPGDTFKLEVVIKNISQGAQTIDVPNIVWAAGTDVPQIVIPGWPARGGIGPVVIFKTVTIAAGDSYKHEWTANVPATDVPGEIAFRVGVPLHRGGDKTWSEPVTVKIVAKGEKITVANPLYDAWKGQEKKTVTFARQETISGGAPVPGGGGRTIQSTVINTCAKITDDQADIDVTQGDGPAQTLIVPAALNSDDPRLPKEAGSEDVTIGGKTYTCSRYTYSTDSKVEMGRDGQGLRGHVTVWMNKDVPGGIVKRTISLTIRASYEITDTLVAGQ